MPGKRPPTARRYAQAIFQLALEKGQFDQWILDIEWMLSATQDQEALVLLELPGLKPEQRLSTIKKALPDLSEFGANFMSILAENQGLKMLTRVQESLQGMIDEYQGIIRGKVTTAIDLDAAGLSKVRADLKGKWGKEVILETQNDPTIIGGMILRVGDHVIDGSTRGRLNSLRQELSERSSR